MKIINRKGNEETLSLDKILRRIRRLCNDPDFTTLTKIDPDVVSNKVVQRLYNNIKTEEIDEISAKIAANLSSTHPEYEELALRISVSNLHKKTIKSFSRTVELMYNNERNGIKIPLISQKLYNIVMKNKTILNDTIVHNRDYLFDFFGYKTLEGKYLLKNSKNEIFERPQYLWMRVSIGIHEDNIEKVIETYNLMSQFYFTHASPTLFNSGTDKQQNSSCFLVGIGDSMDKIYKCIADCAMISKHAGGIGVHISNIRAKGTIIKSSNGESNGIVPMLKVFNETARYANQGGKRLGSIAIYIEPWHKDIFDFLELRKNTGDENNRARDLFYALWIPDNFMRAVENDTEWYLMSEDTCPGLSNTYGEEFENLYNKYVLEGKYLKIVSAQEIWKQILISQIETGMPYMSYKDNVNSKNNQKNYGTIKSSNLCNEVNIYSDDKEYGTCNIATVGLPKFIDTKTNTFDFNKLKEVVKVITYNLNRIIDVNYYPVKEAEISNKKHRPIIIGAQGLANVFFQLKIPFESDEAKTLNSQIYETIYFSSLEASNELARIEGSYETYEGSPFSKGQFQQDLCGVKENELSGLWDWKTLRENVIKYGIRNSMLTASPPTASTSQILGNYESFEPPMNNIFTRETLSGSFFIVNKFLMKDLEELGLWNEEMKEKIIYHNGSIQNIEEIPYNLKKLYKTVWEVSQKTLINLSRDRGLFTDHSQSLNLYMREPTAKKLTAAHFHGWKLGLKTGMYYLRSLAKGTSQKFSVSAKLQKKEEEKLLCSINNPGNCEACSG